MTDRRHPRVINLSDAPLVDHRHGERYQAQLGPLANEVGARKLGYRLVVLPPGKRAWPRHAHHQNEELFIILSGSGTAVIGDERVPVHEDDLIAAPPDPDEPHQLINDSDSELRYLAVSTMEEPEIVSYPDSDKLGVIAGSPPGGDREKRTVFHFTRHSDDLGYWHGEE